MRSAYPTAMAVVTLVAVSAAASSADRVRGASGQQGIEQRIEAPSTVGVASPPLAIALDSQDVDGVLGKEVRSSADENMGRIVNVVVDRNAQPRAAVIDFGGFLGIGSRKLAVDWTLLHFGPAGDGRGRITMDLTADEVRAAPEYKEGKPVVILDGLHNLPVPD
jgi:PRC-barrel domain protein